MNVLQMNRIINIFLLIFLFSFSLSQIYDFSDFPNDDELFSVADFRLYIPEDIDTIRGIYAYMHGFGGDSRHIVLDSTMQALSESVSFALMGELAKRLRKSDQHIEALSLSDAEHRIGVSILNLAEEIGVIRRGKVTIENFNLNNRLDMGESLVCYIRFTY